MDSSASSPAGEETIQDSHTRAGAPLLPATRYAPPAQVIFLQGLATHAPGVSRAQVPLIAAMARHAQYAVRPASFPVVHPQLWFPLTYGVMPVWAVTRSTRLLHIGNGWYAHLVPFFRGPSIVTCHDLIELEEVRAGARRLRPHRRFHIEAAFRGMQRARFIACVSQTTADRVAAHAPRAADRIRVIHSGLSPVFHPAPPDGAVLRQFGLNAPYVLYVGSEQERKNLPRLVAAVAAARRQIPHLHFVKVGEAQTPEGRARFLEALEREGIRESATLLERTGDAELRSLYAGALATLLVSLDEGFGFPALESMACGTPAIVARRGALVEVTGGAALAVDPLDVRSIAEAIVRVAQDSGARGDLVQRGLHRAAQFTWERAADQYAALYDEALSSP